MCTAFKSRSHDLCNAVALLAKRICTEETSPESIFTLSAIKPDILKTVGTSQLCAGQEGGCEAAVHAMRLIFADDKCLAALLVDALNAFNLLNRKVAVHYASLVCPSLAKILHNVYQDSTSLYVDGEAILSNEGTPRVIRWLWYSAP